MSVDLADYSKPIREALRKTEFACVYVIACPGAEPLCRLGYAVSPDNLSAAVSKLQRSSPAALSIENVFWVPDRAIANNIVKATQCDLVAHKSVGGWYSIAPEAASHAIDLSSLRIYPGATTIWHDHLISSWRAKATRSA